MLAVAISLHIEQDSAAELERSRNGRFCGCGSIFAWCCSAMSTLPSTSRTEMNGSQAERRSSPLRIRRCSMPATGRPAFSSPFVRLRSQLAPTA